VWHPRYNDVNDIVDNWTSPGTPCCPCRAGMFEWEGQSGDGGLAGRQASEEGPPTGGRPLCTASSRRPVRPPAHEPGVFSCVCLAAPMPPIQICPPPGRPVQSRAVNAQFDEWFPPEIIPVLHHLAGSIPRSERSYRPDDSATPGPVHARIGPARASTPSTCYDLPVSLR
jgi:hypothetical protein